MLVQPNYEPSSINSRVRVCDERQYYRALGWLYDLQRIGTKFGLALLSALGEPHRCFSSVHIAGTNGKGSTAAYLAAMLDAAGYRVGLYTSPHLVDFTERIKISGRIISQNCQGLQSIPPDQVTVYLTKIKDIINSSNVFSRSAHGTLNGYEADSPEPQLNKALVAHPTFFEVATALAFACFADHGVDIAVIETGMGGRLDATNVLQPQVAVITNINMDHQQYLGSTPKKIAKEKAGIIKDGIMVVSGVEEPELQAVLLEECRKKQAKLHFLRPDVIWRQKEEGCRGQEFSLKTPVRYYSGLRIRLRGTYQAANAALAVMAAEALCSRESAHLNWNISEDAVCRGLANTRWDGRMQVWEDVPLPGSVSFGPVPLVLDGAHNPGAARTLADNLRRCFYFQSLILILGVMQDKDIQGIAQPLVNLAQRLIMTKADNDRAAAPELLARSISFRPDQEMIIASDVEQALASAKNIANPGDLICLAGSLYLVGDAIRYLRGLPKPRWKSVQ